MDVLSCPIQLAVAAVPARGVRRPAAPFEILACPSIRPSGARGLGQRRGGGGGDLAAARYYYLMLAEINPPSKQQLYVAI